MDDGDENEENAAIFVKKQLNPMACASCETKLKHVPTKPGNYAHWKKLPSRDPMDRLPRAG